MRPARIRDFKMGKILFVALALIGLLYWQRHRIKNFYENATPKDYKILFGGFGAISGFITGLIAGILNFQGGSEGSAKVAIIAGGVALTLIILTAIAMLFRKNKPPCFWKNFTINALLFLAGFIVGVFIGFFTIALVVLVIACLLIYYGVFSGGSSRGSSSSSSVPSHHCCASCARNRNGFCAVDNKLIGDPNAETNCGQFSF